MMEEHSESQINQLFQAVRIGNLQTVKRFLHQGYSVDTADENGETLLIKATFSSQLKMVRFLISQEANVNLWDRRLQQTPLIRAARIGDYRILNVLIENGAYLNNVDHQLHTALMKASANGHCACVNLLTRCGAMLNAVDDSGLTALMKASHIGNVTSLELLVNFGASLNLMDANHNTALKLAVGRGNVQCVELLLEHNANVCATDVLVKVVSNWYPFMDGSTERLQRDLECVRMLVGHGAYLNAADNLANTLLMRAVAIGFLECVYYLCEQPDLCVNLINDSGETALMIASQTGHVAILEAVLNRGARVNMVDMHGNTAIMHASHNNNPACVQVLAAHHADVNVGDPFRFTPLMFMTLRGHQHCVELLVRHGALVHQTNGNGQTALDLARSNNHRGIYWFLRGWRDV